MGRRWIMQEPLSLTYESAGCSAPFRRATHPLGQQAEPPCRPAASRRGFALGLARGRMTTPLATQRATHHQQLAAAQQKRHQNPRDHQGSAQPCRVGLPNHPLQL